VDFAAERFLGAPRWQDTIDDVLQTLGEATRASRVYIFQARRDENDGETYSSLLHEWTAPGIEPVIADPSLQDRPLVANGLGRWGSLLDRDQVVHGPVRTFPEAERKDLENENVLSVLMAPIFVEQHRWGSIGFDDCRVERDWDQGEIEAVRAAAGTLGAAIERLGTEQQLRETEAKYRVLVEQIPAILYIDEPGTDDNTIYISPQIEAILGLTAEDWLSDSSLWYKYLHPDDREQAQLTYRRGVTLGEPFSFEYRMQTPRGIIWIRDDAIVLQTKDSRPLVQGVMFDITEQKNAELALQASERREREAAQQLRDLDQMKNTFLAAVSHELRSPLTAVLGLALTMEHQDLPDEDRADLLARLVSNARKLERLLADLLDIDRLARGVISPQLHPTDVGALVRRIVESSEALNGRRIEIETEPVVADVDSPKVERIVENLLVNAVRHTEDATTVWVRAVSNDGGVLIAVEDDGPGVPEDIRTAIFEPFRQGPTASPYAPGTGIGLTLVSRFAQLHGGRAWVEDRPGGGASFRVFLPKSSGDDGDHQGTR
jgi:PAS domain S-box-containing protein